MVGRTFLHALMQAADRGVRVRLLLDDMFTKGYDAGMAALCDHENFEIRIFNPFQRNEVTTRSLAGVMKDFQRVNRRMHNKTFTVDNQITIIGGRNMADEYFGVNTKQRFHDDDVLAIGPIVQEVSAIFDRYWCVLLVVVVVASDACTNQKHSHHNKLATPTGITQRPCLRLPFARKWRMPRRHVMPYEMPLLRLYEIKQIPGIQRLSKAR